MEDVDHGAASSLNTSGTFVREAKRSSGRRARTSGMFGERDDTAREPLLALEDSNRFSSESDPRTDSTRSYDAPSYTTPRSLSIGRPASALVLNSRGLGQDLSMSGGYVTIQEPTLETPDNNTTLALHKCKQTVLKPYLRLLAALGWQQLLPDDGTKRLIKVVNFLYPGLVMILILFGYIIQYAACFRRDRPTYRNKTTGIEVTCSDHIGTVYIIPDILHSAAYLYAFYIFRLGENEQLLTLMERVFLQTSSTQSGYLSQQNLTRRLRWLLRCNVIWVILNVIAQVVHVISLHVGHEADYNSFTWIDAKGGSIYILSVLMIIGLAALDVVYATIVINYATQCELLIIMLRSLSLKVRQKLVSLLDVMKEINDAQKYLKVLNEKVATAVSLLMFNFGTMFVLGIQSVLDVGGQEPVFTASTIISCSLWFLILAVPVIQAARLSTAGWSVSKVGLEVSSRPFGYQDTSQEEINAFLLFTSSLNLRAKLFRVPIHPRWLFGILVVSSFTVLLLLQLQVIGTF